MQKIWKHTNTPDPAGKRLFYMIEWLTVASYVKPQQDKKKFFDDQIIH